MGTCQFLDSRSGLLREFKTQLQASADEFHVSFVLSAACTSAGIQVDPFPLGHAEATASARAPLAAHVDFRHRRDSGYVGRLPIRVYYEAPPSIGKFYASPAPH